MGSTANGGSGASLQASLRAVRAGPIREHARRDRVSGVYLEHARRDRVSGSCGDVTCPRLRSSWSVVCRILMQYPLIGRVLNGEAK